MGAWSDLFGNSVREYHKDGSYTDRDEGRGTSETYNSDGSLREFSRTTVPLIGNTHVDTYDSDGNRVNTTYPKK